MAGGSSGGSGSVVACGLVSVALGTDTGGSIRIPAAVNGVYGYKPTINHWPSDYGLKLTDVRDTVGPIASNIHDILAISSLFLPDITTYPIINCKDLRIGVLSYYLENLYPDIL
jgi:mandelamide amidase